MKKSNQFGRSMSEMLGVLAVVGVLSVGGLAGFSKAMYKHRLQKTFSFVSDSIMNYQLFIKRDLGTYPSDPAHIAEAARTYELIPECQPEPSVIAGPTYQVCHAPLGEIYPRFFVTDTETGIYYTYMLYVTFTTNNTQSCIDFLSRNWARVVPEKNWRRGHLWITTDSAEDVMYSETVNKLDAVSIVNSCNFVCENSKPYCSIVFDFTYLKY